jgi:transcriptional regulator GlxA family with amidase domain
MKNIAIVLFDKIEVLDFAGPFEVFSVCGAHGENKGYFNVYTVAEKAPVNARGGLSINPHFLLDNCPTPDIFLIPGGGGYTKDGLPFGSRLEMNNPVLLDWIRKQNKSAEMVLSVCTGSLILGKAGLLDGLSATTHWKSMDQLKDAAPKTTLVYDKRWVDSGRIVTSAGVSAGIDMSLYVVGRLLGKDIVNETARSMQYDHWSG